MVDVFLYAPEANPNDLRLRDPTTASGGGNTPLNVTLGQASWVWTGFAPGVNTRLDVFLGQASWVWTSFAIKADFKLGVTLGQAIWSWVASPLSGLGQVVAALGLYPVRGSKENRRPGSHRGGADT